MISTEQHAPWDADPVEIALFGLAGIVVGAVLSWVGSEWSDRRRQRHEGRVIVRAEKLAAYSSFSAAAKEFVVILYRVAAGKGIDATTETLTAEAAEPALAAAFHARDRAFEQMRLVGSDESTARARAWVRQIYEMRNYLSSGDVDEAGWEGLVARVNDARDAFHHQARTELSVL